MSHRCLTGRRTWHSPPPGSVWSWRGRWHGWAGSPRRKGSAARPCTRSCHGRRPPSMWPCSDLRSRTSAFHRHPPSRRGGRHCQLCRRAKRHIQILNRSHDQEVCCVWGLITGLGKASFHFLNKFLATDYLSFLFFFICLWLKHLCSITLLSKSNPHTMLPVKYGANPEHLPAKYRVSMACKSKCYWGLSGKSPPTSELL